MPFPGQLATLLREPRRRPVEEQHPGLGLRRIATDFLRRAAVDPVAAKAIIGHTMDRMREHYATVGEDEARSIGERVVALVPAVRR